MQNSLGVSSFQDFAELNPKSFSVDASSVTSGVQMTLW